MNSKQLDDVSSDEVDFRTVNTCDPDWQEVAWLDRKLTQPKAANTTVAVELSSLSRLVDLAFVGATCLADRWPSETPEQKKHEEATRQFLFDFREVVRRESEIVRRESECGGDHRWDWIPISRRLPDLGEEVLATNGIQRFVAARQDLIGQGYCWIDPDENVTLTYTVTHWQPLPPPPG